MTSLIRYRPEVGSPVLPPWLSRRSSFAKALAFSVALHLALLALVPAHTVTVPVSVLPVLEAVFATHGSETAAHTSKMIPSGPIPAHEERTLDIHAVPTLDPPRGTGGRAPASASATSVPASTRPLETAVALAAPPASATLLPPPWVDTRWYDARQLDALPRPLRPGSPEYPEAARRRDQEGEVKVRLLIDERGAVQAVEIVESSDPALFDAAVHRFYALQSYAPALRNGVPVRARIEQRVRFRQD